MGLAPSAAISTTWSTTSPPHGVSTLHMACYAPFCCLSEAVGPDRQFRPSRPDLSCREGLIEVSCLEGHWLPGDEGVIIFRGLENTGTPGSQEEAHRARTVPRGTLIRSPTGAKWGLRQSPRRPKDDRVAAVRAPH